MTAPWSRVMIVKIKKITCILEYLECSLKAISECMEVEGKRVSEKG